MKKSNPTIKAHILRSAFFVFLLVGVCAIPLALSQWSFNGGMTSATPSKQTQTTLTFADRVAYQRVIEEVYWQHRIWPEENEEPKPSLDEVMSAQEIEKKVENYLRNSQALETYWQQPITSEQLQAEMERMARNTKQPEVLRELFEALGNDPFVIAECLARPVLTEGLVADLSAYDKSQRFALLQAQAAGSKSSITTLGTATYALSEIPDVCTDNTWTPTSLTNAPGGRTFHTAVWTGSETIVWGGTNGGNSDLNTGGRYNPTTDTWTATSTTNAPDPRDMHTAVWTGSAMIVWGGFAGYMGPLNTGGRYNPSTDSWTATSTTNAPSARFDHTAVWTGSQMIVWGGLGSGPTYLKTGRRYNPSTDSWTATSLADAPAGRQAHTAVWIGSEMIVWGGFYEDINYTTRHVNTGGRYNPITDIWTATSTINPPSGRSGHTAVWAGSRMIVWGGRDDINHFNTGGRYSPSTDSWTATSTTNAPTARVNFPAVWTDSQMIVWGGIGSNVVNTGGRYNPSTDSWTATSTTNAPVARSGDTAIWTGSQMIAWGGYNGGVFLNTGGRYCAGTGGPPSPPTAHPATLATYSSFRANWSSVSGATGYRLDVSTNSSFSTYVPGYQNLNVGNATSRGVSGLNPSTTYYYRVRAYNGASTSGNSNTVHVTTLSPTGPPVVITNPATNVASSSATLNGSVDPHGLTTTVHFQYGTTTAYGHTTANQTKTGNAYQNVAANVNGLGTHTTYHFRIVATNNAGTRYGSDRTFTTH